MEKKSHFVIILLVILAIFVLYFLLVSINHPTMESRGQFGDMFGGLNALFSGLAFLGLVYTIWLQRTELSLQREELELTRQELKRAAVAQEESQKELSKQAASLKVTAKLNGLSSLLQFELAKPSTQRGLNGGGAYASLLFSGDAQHAEDIVKQIEDIISSK